MGVQVNGTQSHLLQSVNCMCDLIGYIEPYFCEANMGLRHSGVNVLVHCREPCIPLMYLMDDCETTSHLTVVCAHVNV